MRLSIYTLPALCSLLLISSCAIFYVGGKVKYFELHAPDSFRAEGEPYWIGETNPWLHRVKEGCIKPGEVIQLRVSEKIENSLAVIIYRGDSLQNSVLSNGLQNKYTGSGTVNDPYVVSWKPMQRWHRFEQEVLNRKTGINNGKALNAYLLGNAQIKQQYDSWLSADNEIDPYRNIKTCS